MAAIGYARVSTTDQDLALQLDALANVGCARIFEDTASGAKAERPGLAAALSFARDGDILTVWKLDRLGRSLPHLIETVNALEARRQLPLSNRSDQHHDARRTARLSHFWRARAVRAGPHPRTHPRRSQAAATRGRQGGRKPVMTDEKLRRAHTLRAQGLTVREVAARIKVGKTALYAALAQTAPEPAAAGSP